MNKRASQIFTRITGSTYESLSIEQVLSNPPLKATFFSFLVNQRDGELVDFLKAVEIFECDWNLDIELGAHILIDTYIRQNAKKEINISQQARRSLMRDIDVHLTCNDRQKVFAKIKTRVKVQLQEEKIPMFLKSQEYQTYKNNNRRTISFARLSKRLSVSLLGFDLTEEEARMMMEDSKESGESGDSNKKNNKGILSKFDPRRWFKKMTNATTPLENNSVAEDKRKTVRLDFNHPLKRRVTH
jgi:hypothetical protein